MRQAFKQLAVFAVAMFFLAMVGLPALAAQAAPEVGDAFWQRLANAALSRDWILVTGLGLVLLQYALRAHGSPVTKWFPWLVNTTLGGWTLNLLVSFCGALSLEVIGKHELSWSLVVQTLVLTATSTAVHHGIKDTRTAPTKQPSHLDQ